MKKHLKYSAICLVATFILTITVIAAYNFGPNGRYRMNASAGIDWFGGNYWAQGTMTSNTLEGDATYIRVYARQGDAGTWSGWTEGYRGKTHRDYGKFKEADYSEVKGEWK